MRIPVWIRQHVAALRALLVLTLLTGIVYPLAVWGVSFLPGLHDKAEGSLIKVDGRTVGSSLVGQLFTGKNGDPLTQYFQSRPSAAGDGYDMTSTSAGNLGPEDIVDSNARKSLLTQICARSLAVGRLEGVDGSRPFCTPGGAGAVLAVFGDRDAKGTIEHPTRVVSVNERQGVVKAPFVATYKGVPVQLAKSGADYSAGQIVPIRGDAPADPQVPADAVAASASGLDPDISPAYARIQTARVAKARGITAGQVEQAISDNEAGRTLGFMGEPRVNVLRLNLELDAKYPYYG
jgi:K+-transporting ATPase ATPase C chain